MLSTAKAPLNTNPTYLKPLMTSSNCPIFDVVEIVETIGIDTESDINLIYEALL